MYTRIKVFAVVSTRFFIIAAITLLLVLNMIICQCVFFGLEYVYGRIDSPLTTIPTTMTMATPRQIVDSANDVQTMSRIQNNNSNMNNSVLKTESKELNNIFKKVQDSVVYVHINLNNNYYRSGSGFVYDRNQGYIVTNNHVVNGSINGKADVTFSDGNTYTTKIIGTDVYDDLAVLQIIDDFSEEHPITLTLGNSSQLEVGQVVIAIGNPGILSLTFSNTMTMGIISQLGRVLPNIIGDFPETDLIQTDTVINHGNSGGPLLDADAHVVGITAMGFNSTGLNFAIPSNLVLRIVPSLIQKGHYDHPWLGFSGATLDPLTAESFGLVRNAKGVMLFSVDIDGPLYKAGLGKGDIITKVDQIPVNTIADLLTYVEEHKSVGDNITLTVNRNGQIMDFDTLIQARPSSS